MRKFAISMIVAMFCAMPCRADIGDVRPLGEVFSQSDTILFGVVVGSGVGECGGKRGNNSFYMIRVEKVVKGRIKPRDVKMCGAAPLLLGQWYVVSGNKYSNREVVFLPDAALYAFSDGRFYRLVAFDSPIFETSRGEVYGVAIIEKNLKERFADLLGNVGF